MSLHEPEAAQILSARISQLRNVSWHFHTMPALSGHTPLLRHAPRPAVSVQVRSRTFSGRNEKDTTMAPS